MTLTPAAMPKGASAEGDLVARTRAGDPEALASLYRLHGAGVVTLAARLTGSREDAEDVLHDLFVGLAEALRRYEDRGALGPWLRRVAARMALMRMRSAKRRAEVDLDAASQVARPSGGSGLESSRIASAVRSLSPALRSVFVLREIEGFTHQEIAGLLGISTSASEARLSRAMSALRAILKESR